jgi:hypothetical protein
VTISVVTGYQLVNDNFELREDGSFELREDGFYELRQ